MNKVILVTGADGQVGNEIRLLAKNYNYDFLFADRKTLDITNTKTIYPFCKLHNVDTIINCAAYTAVDKAEEDKDIAYQINHLAVENLAIVSQQLSIKLIHLSTDYVFDGHHYLPYKEEDIPTPCGIYAISKYRGEKALLDINPKNSIIIRTSWVYSLFKTNFVKTMLRLGAEKDSLNVVFDQIGTPTYAGDLAKAILDILPNIKNDHVKIYHYSNEGVLSWYDFAKEIMKMAKLTCKILPIETKDYPTPAKRPHYSVLSKSKIKDDFELHIPYWKDSLSICLKKMGAKI